MANTYNIYGHVRMLSNHEGLQDITVKIYKSGSGLELAQVTSKPTGFFQFLLNEADVLVHFPGDEPVRLSFSVVDPGGHILLEEAESIVWTPQMTEAIDIFVDVVMPEVTTAYIISITGTVTDDKGAVLPNVDVEIFETAFREKTLLGTTTTDFRGLFSFDVTSDQVVNTDVLSKRTISFDVSKSGTLLGVLNNVLLTEKVDVSITVGNTSPALPPGTLDEAVLPEFNNLQNTLNYIIGDVNIGTIGDDDAVNNSNEIDYLVKATGKSEQQIRSVVNAYKFSAAVEDANPGVVTVDKNFMYALSRQSGSPEANPVLKVKASEIRTAITTAIEQRAIPLYGEDVIESAMDDFVEKVKVYQREATKAIPIQHEEYTLNDILTTIFSAGSPTSAQADVDDFLSAYNSEGFATVKDFWADYESTGLADKAKMGLKLAAVTGFQKDVIADLITETYENVDPNFTNTDIRKLATWDQDAWISRITDVCVNADKLCVPQGIRGAETDYTTEEGAAAIDAYAKKMRTMVQDMFPLTNIKHRLEDAGDLIEDTDRREQVITFLADNPDIDLRQTRVHDINSEDFNLENISSEDELKADLEPFQRLLQVTNGKPEAVAAFIVDGIDSAAAIAAMPQAEFVANYATVLGGTAVAATTYTTATLINGATTVLATGTTTTQMGTLPTVFAPWYPAPPPPSADPDLATLFGNQNYCGCDHCSSLYSASAYLVDILNFLKTSSSSPSVYNELIRRRPDLIHIDLTCKNTNTSLPYIDLVNELLEKRILTGVSITPPNSFQTSGTTRALAAHPEHIYKDGSDNYIDYRNYRLVYDDDASITHQSPLNKAAAVYPYKLPFNLALEETRTYLQYLGADRFELMKLYKPYATAPTYGITNTEIYSEWLGLTTADADTAAQIITAAHTNSANTWLFYGISGATSGYVFNPAQSGTTITVSNWATTLTGRIDVLIQQSKITYKDLLQLLTTDFLNKPDGSGNRDIAIVTNAAGVPEDTCDLSKLKLEFSGTATATGFLGKLHRFIRLWKSSKMDIYQLDTVFRALDITALNNSDFVMLGRVLHLATRLKIKPELLATWWMGIDTHVYNNYNTGSRPERIVTLYEQIFSNRAVLNLPVEEFEDPASLPSAYTGHTALIAAAARIKEDEVLEILGHLQVTISSAVTLRVLSAIYAIGAVSRTLKYNIKDLLVLFDLTLLDSSAFTVDNDLGSDDTLLIALEELLRVNDLLKISGLNMQDVLYVCKDLDEKNQYTSDKLKIQLFFERMRSELQKIKSVFDPNTIPADISDKLKNSVNQSLAKEFETTSELAIAATSNLTFAATSDNVMDWLISPEFVDSTGDIVEGATISGNLITNLYAHYKYVDRLIFLLQAMGVKYEEFVFMYEDSSLTGLDFFTLSEVGGMSDADASMLFYNILRLANWLQVRSRLRLNSEDFMDMMKYMQDGNVSGKEGFVDIIERYTKWGSFLTELIGAANSLSDKGLLLADFATDFQPDTDKAPALLLKIADIISHSYRTGLSPLTIYDVLKTNLILSNSNKILLAAKGKQDDATWLEIAKPLRDEIRRKQRDAMVAYLLATPNTGNYEYWRNENELFEHFLIDVEMEPCMLTSRIKQAISSVQIFVDRVMMGFEYQNNQYNNSGLKLSLPGNMPEEWKKWRKWYRIWEANRKVFLYPENWIEPELRDDKSVFFEEFEAEMQKDEVTDALAEDAIRHYLEKLDEVARLEPVSNCTDDDGIVHAFARTYGEPHKYFYRRLIGDVWTPWEVMEIEIKSDHIVPIVWNRRLRIYWTTYRDRVEKFYVKNYDDLAWFNNENEPGWAASPWFHNNDFKPNNPGRILTSSEPNQHIIDITLNWSEYQNGTWMKQTVSKESIPIKLNPKIEKYLRHQINGYFGSDSAQFYNMLTGKQQISAVDMVKSRFYLYPFFTYGKSFLHIWVMYPYNAWLAEDVLIHTASFKFNDSNLQPEIDRDTQWKITYLGPNKTYVRNMKHVENPLNIAGWGGDKPFHKSKYGNFNFNLFYQYNPAYHINEKVKGYTGNDTFLHTTKQGLFKITAKSNMTYNPTDNHFFFEDDKNTYFVRIPGNGLWDVVSVGTDSGVLSGGTLTSDSGTVLAGGGSFTFDSGTILTVDSNESLSGAIAWTDTVYGGDQVVAAGGLDSGTVVLTGGGWTTNDDTVVVAAQDPQGSYFFQTFYHHHVKEFMKALNSGGIGALLRLETQVQSDNMDFVGNYNPNPWLVMNKAPMYKYPENKVEFEYWGAYSGYNWELFFHIPLLIAQRLGNNQRFEEAQKWFHYIFNPTSNTNAAGAATTGVERFWRFRPFYDKSLQPIETLSDILTNISNGQWEAVTQINTWKDNPFKPHAIARIRILAYMKNVVMKYLDNLIAWADQLFRRDTMESINEATNLYILAANILGQRPQEVPPRATSAPKSFNQLITGSSLDAFSNALVKLESYIDPHSLKGLKANLNGTTVTGSIPKIAYFCLPKNDKLAGYWDTVADRLFKIRNCMNIEGQTRSLPLFEPPIDPSILVKAAAAGIDINSVLDAVNGEAPHYKFTYILQKANELCGDVKALGGALLSALEKKDAEAIAVLRSGHEISVLEKVRMIKETQLQETDANIQALVKTKEVTQARLQYYSTRPYMNAKELESMNRLKEAMVLSRSSGNFNTLASSLALLPQANLQLPFAFGVSFGGNHLSDVMRAISGHKATLAGVQSALGNMAATTGGYDRRQDDWKFQADTAQRELAQLDKQIEAANIRRLIVEKELDSHDKQMENAVAVDEYMRSKYTNQQLYNWMISQISTVYFQAYQLAYDMAKKAERCYEYELPLGKKSSSGYIKFGYWDSLRKGLMSGERLQLDLRHLEAAYIESNERELEMTKNVSLLLTDPKALMDLRKNGKCDIYVNEELFDLDYPGHYFRRIKTVSLSIPCITGPYTTINATLTLNNSAIRKNPSTGGLELESITAMPAIATSTAQNDSGMFELNFRDERYLPFEGRGAVSVWNLTIADTNQIRLFDFDTISDVILHVKYTARHDGALKTTVISNLNSLLAGNGSAYYDEDDEIIGGGSGFANLELPRYFTLKHEYANQWFNYATGNQLAIGWNHDTFPVYAKGKTITVNAVYLKAQHKAGVTGDFRIVDLGSSGISLELSPAFDGLQSGISIEIEPGDTANLQLRLQKETAPSTWNNIDVNDVFEDIYMIAYYTIE